jgi:hypothetical protein
MRRIQLRRLDRDRRRRPRQRCDQSEEVEAALSLIVEHDEPGGGQAKRFSAEIGEGVKQATSVSKQLALEGLRAQLDEMVSLVRQVLSLCLGHAPRGRRGAQTGNVGPETYITDQGRKR